MTWDVAAGVIIGGLVLMLFNHVDKIKHLAAENADNKWWLLLEKISLGIAAVALAIWVISNARF